jgi:predicted  nucleic acid-binding Zn ribbon protein
MYVKEESSGLKQRLRRQPYFVLFANFLTDESPVRCGHCFGPVPLYTLPAMGEAGDFQDVLSWQSTYQAMDWLFIGTGAGEHYGHRQMFRQS